MKFFILLTITCFTFLSLATPRDENIKSVEAFQYCVEDCMAFSELGWELRACIEKCRTQLDAKDQLANPLYCNTDEEGCHQEGDDGGLF